MIFQYNNVENLEKIKEDYTNILLLKESLADKRAQYREFAGSIDLEESILLDCIDRYEAVLLISCYTFSEQLTKNFFYHLIDKDNNNNKHVNNFINNKVPSDRFSPNVKIQGLNKLLNEIDKDFTFIITNQDRVEFKIYNEMITSRHLYAHANKYTFNFGQFPEVILVLEYLNFEYRMHVEDEYQREQIKTLYKQIKKLVIIDLKSGKNFDYNNHAFKYNLKNLKKQARLFIYNYKYILSSNKLFEDLLIYIEEISIIDLRKADRNKTISALLSKLAKII